MTISRPSRESFVCAITGTGADCPVMGVASDHVKGWLIDLNGVLYVGSEALPGASDGLQWLRETGRPCRFVSNTTTRSAASLAEKLARLGFDIDPEDLFTAPKAGAAWLKSEGIHRCHFLVADDVRETEFGDFEDAPPGESSAVVIGDIGARWDFVIMNEAFGHLRHGARLVALHRSKYSQSEDGLTLDIGPFVAGLEYASGQDAVVVGKPSPAFFQTALASLGCDAAEAVMIGDDIEGDIGGAQQAGLKGILTKTGKYRPELVKRSDVEPDLVIDSLGALPVAISS